MKRFKEEWPEPYFTATDRACLWCMGFSMVIVGVSGLAWIINQ